MFDTYLRERLNREGYRYFFEGMEQINQELTLDELKFHVTSYGTAPLLWISNNNTATYNIFKSFMDELDIMDEIKSLVDFNNN